MYLISLKCTLTNDEDSKLYVIHIGENNELNSVEKEKTKEQQKEVDDFWFLVQHVEKLEIFILS